MSFELRDHSPQLLTLCCLYSGAERPLQIAHEMGMTMDQRRDMLRVFARHGLITDPTQKGFRITEWGRAVFEDHCLCGSNVSTVTIPPARWVPDPTPPDQRIRVATTPAASRSGARRSPGSPRP